MREQKRSTDAHKSGDPIRSVSTAQRREIENVACFIEPDQVRKYDRDHDHAGDPGLDEPHGGAAARCSPGEDEHQEYQQQSEISRQQQQPALEADSIPVESPALPYRAPVMQQNE